MRWGGEKARFDWRGIGIALTLIILDEKWERKNCVFVDIWWLTVGLCSEPVSSVQGLLQLC